MRQNREETGKIVPRDRKSGRVWNRFNYDHPYPAFNREENRNRVGPGQVWRFPDWMRYMPVVRKEAEHIEAEPGDPAPPAMVKPILENGEDGEETINESIGRIGALLGAEVGRKGVTPGDVSGTSLMEKIHRDAEILVTNAVAFRSQYAKLSVRTSTPIRRENGATPAAYLEKIEEKMVEALDAYYQAYAALENINDAAGRYNVVCDVSDFTRLHIPKVKGTGFEERIL